MTAQATLSPTPTLTSLRAELKEELVGRILPFWMQRAVDKRNGGYVGLIYEDGTVVHDAPKSSMRSNFVASRVARQRG